MKQIKTYKIFESEDWTNDTFQTIHEYITEICDTLDLDLHKNETDHELYGVTISNGILVYRFVDKYYDIVEPERAHTFIISIKIKDSFRIPNEDKVKDMLNWIIERIDDSEIKVSDNSGLKFYSNDVQTWKATMPYRFKDGRPIPGKTFTKYEIIFDIIKKVL